MSTITINISAPMDLSIEGVEVKAHDPQAKEWRICEVEVYERSLYFHQLDDHPPLSLFEAWESIKRDLVREWPSVAFTVAHQSQVGGEMRAIATDPR